MQPKQAWFVGILLMVDGLFFDQLSKWIMSRQSPLVGDFSFVHLRLSPSVNEHFAFSIPAPSWLILSVVAAVLAAVIWKWREEAAQGLLSSLGLAAIIGGAASNIVDRLRLGGVYDFLEIGIQGSSVSSLNVADIYIISGVLLWGYFTWSNGRQTQPYAGAS